MKKIIKTLSVILAVIMVLELPLTAFASSTKSKYTGLNYTQNSRFDDYTIINGIDVSEHNGTIDFDKVKNDGIDFVFIRVGYTGYTKSGFVLKYDKNYKTYISDARDAGLDIGVYWYSQALTPAEATEEAVTLLSALNGIDLELPVVYDYEFAGTSSGRLDSAKLSKAKKTENALAFLNTVASAGYEACLYASENFLLKEMNVKDIESIYPIWLANYNTKTKYEGEYDFWQYSSKGKVSGIQGNTDVNFRYIDDVIKLDNQIFTGSPITPEPMVIDANTGYMMVKDIDYVLEYQNNIEVGTAIITAIGINNFAGFTAQYSFKIVPDRTNGIYWIGADDTILAFSWNAVPGASEYNLYLTNTATNKTYCYNTLQNYLTIGKLTEGTKYSVYVTAGIRNSFGDVIFGDASDTIFGVTTGAKVSGFAVKTRDDKSITLKWNKLENADGYNIYRYDSYSGSYKLITTVSGMTTSYKVASLKPSTTYKFKISAIVSGRENKKSDALKTVTTPKKVTLSSAKSASARKITVKFKSTTANGYQVQWSTKKNFSSNYKSINVSKGKKTAQITTASRNKNYYVRIRAYKILDGKKYYGSWSTVKTVKVK